jgi:hypothetical protein
MFVSSESVKTNRLVSTITVFEFFGTFCKGQKHLNIVWEGFVPLIPINRSPIIGGGYFQNSQ